MRRPAAVLTLVVVLSAALAGLARTRLERLGETRVPAGLLYLPRGPWLRALAVGQEETLADLLYIWAIQYYSNYEDTRRYEYLDQVFRGAITELDPYFTEAYLVGALIMSVEARRPELALALYDKGLAKMPDNWELGYWAGWECYYQGRFLCARDYWARASRMPGAPAVLGRLAARMLEKAGDLAAAIREYRRLLEHPPDEKTARVVESWVERMSTELDLRKLDAAVEAFRQERGRCPRNLRELVAERFLARLPRAIDGRPYRYDPRTCRVLPAPGQSFGGGR